MFHEQNDGMELQNLEILFLCIPNRFDGLISRRSANATNNVPLDLWLVKPIGVIWLTTRHPIVTNHRHSQKSNIFDEINFLI